MHHVDAAKIPPLSTASCNSVYAKKPLSNGDTSNPIHVIPVPLFVAMDASIPIDYVDFIHAQGYKKLNALRFRGIKTLRVDSG